MLFSSTLLADCEPDPFTVATLMLKSLITRGRVVVALCVSPRARLLVAMWRDSLPKNSSRVSGSFRASADRFAGSRGDRKIQKNRSFPGQNRQFAPL
jgi:hypothetical protein